MNNLTLFRRPQGSLWDLMSEVERAFDQAWPQREVPSAVEAFRPRVDVRETADSYLIAADLPGLNRNQVKVDLHDGRLTISGERAKEVVTDNDQWHRVERSFGRFERSFQLPTDVEQDKIQARFEDGVLEVLLPKAQSSKVRTVAIDGEKKGLFSKLISSAKADTKEH